jgi:hypothetical protein
LNAEQLRALGRALLDQTVRGEALLADKDREFKYRQAKERLNPLSYARQDVCIRPLGLGHEVVQRLLARAHGQRLVGLGSGFDALAPGAASGPCSSPSDRHDGRPFIFKKSYPAQSTQAIDFHKIRKIIAQNHEKIFFTLTFLAWNFS